MSMMMCDFCDAFIDTDYDCEGAYADKANQFMCSECCFEYEIEDEAGLVAFIAEGEAERAAELAEESALAKAGA